jgi:hypothetical protein
MSSIYSKSFAQPEFAVDWLTRAGALLDAELARREPVPPVPGGAWDKSRDQSANPLASAAREHSLLSPAAYEGGAVGPELLGGSSTGAPTDIISDLLQGAQGDELRRRASQFLETLLESVAHGHVARADSYEDRVPLVRGAAPVRAGSKGSVTLQVSNEETSVSEVRLYTSNLVADSGYEMPSLLISVTPRTASLPPGGQASFEIELAVPAQAPPGLYSGLIQASGCKYVKAVVMFEVV